MKEECYDCIFFKHYNFFTGSVHCEKNGIKQFGFGQFLSCGDFKRRKEHLKEQKEIDE